MRIKVFLWSLLLVIAAYGGYKYFVYKNTPKTIAFNGFAQGTYYVVKYVDSLERNLVTDIDSLLKDFDASCSIYDSASVISKVNRNEDVVLDDIFVQVFGMAQMVAEQTNGAFDVSVGKLADVWGFGSGKQQELSDSMIQALLPMVGYDKVDLFEGKITKEHPALLLNFNAIAQGYSVDLVCAFLEQKGINNYLVDIGGEVKAKGKKPMGNPWVVGIEKPSVDKNSSREIQEKVALNDIAIATSGTYRKYYEKDGMRYAHTIDPRTGYPVQHSLLSVSVITESCALADAYATAFMVMGLVEAKTFLKKHPELEAYFIYYQAGEYRFWNTDGFYDVG